jgi:hypothetical protein
VSLATSPALSRPKMEMLAATESTLHVGTTPCVSADEYAR